MVQESIKLQFGTYTGEVKDGKPHGHGKCVFNSDDIQVSYDYFLKYNRRIRKKFVIMMKTKLNYANCHVS